MVSVSTIVNIDEFISVSDSRFILKRTFEALNISYERVHHQVDLDVSVMRLSGYEKMFYKMEPKMAENFNWKPANFLGSLVSMDKSWVHFYESERKEHSFNRMKTILGFSA